MITTGSLNSQDMIKILKHSRHDFSVKHLCDGYFIGYYVMFMCGGQNSWFCKALRIFYIPSQKNKPRFNRGKPSKLMSN